MREELLIYRSRESFSKHRKHYDLLASLELDHSRLYQTYLVVSKCMQLGCRQYGRNLGLTVTSLPKVNTMRLQRVTTYMIQLQ